MAYRLRFTRIYKTKYEKITRKDLKLKSQIVKVHKLLSLDPHSPSLKSHKVNAVNFGQAWSSRVTGDIRIIWNYDKQEQLIILILNIGSHSGSSKVYK